MIYKSTKVYHSTIGMKYLNFAFALNSKRQFRRYYETRICNHSESNEQSRSTTKRQIMTYVH